MKLLRTAVFIALSVSICLSQSAPGGPGKDAQWASAGKQGVGTSASLKSKVWFTLQGGALTDVYYPNVAVNNFQILQFVVVDPKNKTVETERDDATHEIKVLKPESLSFQQVNTAKNGRWRITKTYTTSPQGNLVAILVKFEPFVIGQKLYLYSNPGIKNSGMKDTAVSFEEKTSQRPPIKADRNGLRIAKSKVMIAKEGDITAEITVYGTSMEKVTNGFVGVNDGLTQLRKHGELKEIYSKATNGNVAQTALLGSPKEFLLRIAFGKDIEDAKKQKSYRPLINRSITTFSPAELFDDMRLEYDFEWGNYLSKLPIPRIAPKYQAQFNMAAMQLRAHEDKTYRGANIASMSVPWGGGDNANKDNVGGYHLVWSRDLYQVFTAFMAIGDKEAAERALMYLLKVQQKPDGSFPQNSWLDGKPFWQSLQLDEVSYPLIMAYRLGKDDKDIYENHLKKAADFIVANGPSTPQERWEEESGYSPSTIAAEIAGLVCVAEIAKKNGDMASAEKYLKTADEWEANLDKWTYTTNGKYGDGNYYIRIAQNGKPNAKEIINLNNGSGDFIENEVVDAGFLELVRLGIRRADDPRIVKSLKVIDEVIKVETPNGPGFYRYNGDGYGEMDDGRRWNWDGKYTGKGRLWVLLSGERGQYELARSIVEEKRGNEASARRFKKLASERLTHMYNFANEGRMIPEQVWDKEKVPRADLQFSPNLRFGEGTGSATPLAWSMAQFIRLATNLKAGKNLDTPDVVYKRYAGRTKTKTSKINPQAMLRAAQIDYGQKCVAKKDEIESALQSPFVAKDGSLVFLSKGDSKKVELVGDFTGWKTAGMTFADVDSGTKCFQMKINPTARFEYKLVKDSVWGTDALNSLKISNGVGGENSFFEMPDYRPSKWTKGFNKLLSSGISEFTVKSKKFGTRKIQAYVPSEVFKRGIAPKLPVLYLQDGSDYISRAKAINVVENLTSAGKIEPFLLVFVDPKERNKEYWANDDWADFMAKELVPAVEFRYFSSVKKGRENRALLGASLGGITSIWTALKHPNVFGRVGAQSASFWVDDERVVDALRKLDKNKVDYNFYIDDGVFEGVSDSRKVVKLLKDKGYSVTYVEEHTGHNWTSWKDRLDKAFVALWK